MWYISYISPCKTKLSVKKITFHQYFTANYALFCVILNIYHNFPFTFQGLWATTIYTENSWCVWKQEKIALDQTKFTRRLTWQKVRNFPKKLCSATPCAEARPGTTPRPDSRGGSTGGHAMRHLCLWRRVSMRWKKWHFNRRSFLYVKFYEV